MHAVLPRPLFNEALIQSQSKTGLEAEMHQAVTNNRFFVVAFEGYECWHIGEFSKYSPMLYPTRESAEEYYKEFVEALEGDNEDLVVKLFQAKLDNNHDYLIFIDEHGKELHKQSITKLCGW